ncbi:hypothetical protein [Nannocystis pusilla]|uniref:hypothetical protein n=1 Tax=Nannocystis pusilla TaxID=889268 RepID=UPI003B79F00D
MRPDPDLARRLELAEHIQLQWYPSWTSAWLKAVAASEVLEPIHREALAEAGADPAALVAARRTIVQTFLEDHFSLCTPRTPPTAPSSTAPGARSTAPRCSPAPTASSPPRAPGSSRSRPRRPPSAPKPNKAAGSTQSAPPGWPTG